MAALYLKINSEHPEHNKIKTIVDALHKGAVIAYPTDTTYGLGCDIRQPKAVERVAAIKGRKASELNMALLFYDLKQLADYTRPIPTSVYRVLKKALPGGFTFVLEANNKVPKIFNYKRTQVGIRIPDHNVPREIVREFGRPIVTTSAPIGRTEDFSLEPEMVYDSLKNQVDIFVDCGYCNNMPSTVVVISAEGEFEVLREGLGDLSEFV